MSPASHRHPGSRSRVALAAAALVAAAAWLSASPARADDLPAFTDYVVDQAHVFDAATVARLQQLCSRLDHAGTAQIAVVTLNPLGDRVAKDVAVELFQRWKLGHDKKRSDGLLLLFVPGPPGHRKVEVEVGYGLEGILPDGKVGRFRDSAAFPPMRENNYGLAAVQLAEALAAVIEGDAAATGDRANVPAPGQGSGGGYHREAVPVNLGLPGLALAAVCMGALLLVLASHAAGRRVPGSGARLAGAGLTGIAALGLVFLGGGLGWLALAGGIIVNAIFWGALRAHRCPRDGSWMTLDEEVLERPTVWSAGVARVSQQCTNTACRYHRTYDKELPRKQQTVYIGGGGGGWGGGGGGGWGGGGGGGGDGFSGGGGGESGGGGAGGEV